MIWEELSPTEWDMAQKAASSRQVESRKLGCARADGTPYPTLEEDVKTCGSEIAVAKYLGIAGFIPTINNFRGPDIEPDIQVHQITNSTHRLVIRPRDLERGHHNHRFVLVFFDGVYERYGLCGWLRARDAIRDEWVHNPYGYGQAWFVPQQYLHSMKDLK